MKYRINTQMGDVLVDDDVIANYAGSIAVECFGIVGMSSISAIDGIAKLLKKEHLANGIKVSVENNKVSLEFHVIVSYGVSISAVSQNLVDTVKYKVEEFIGSPVDKVEVFVEGVRVID